MRRLTSRIPSCLLILLLLSLLPLDFAEASSKKKKKQKPQETPTLRVLAFDLEPFFYRDAGGTPKGLEYDFVRSFAINADDSRRVPGGFEGSQATERGHDSPGSRGSVGGAGPRLPLSNPRRVRGSDG